jgi:hypothetical protein
MEAARLANVTGNNRAKEDDSQGYTLSYDPTLRSKQLAIREYALQSEALLLRVLDSSSDARQRAVAATALGYPNQHCRHKTRQTNSRNNSGCDSYRAQAQSVTNYQSENIRRGSAQRDPHADLRRS